MLTLPLPLAIAALTILRRVILGANQVDFRTILGAISVFTLLGLLFAFLYVFFSRWTHASFFTGVNHARASDYVFFSYTTLTTTGYGNLVPAGTVGQSLPRCPGALPTTVHRRRGRRSTNPPHG